MYKLLMRAFPGYYPPNSVYTLYPFTTPTQNRQVFEKAGTADKLDFNRPVYQGPVIALTSWQGVTQLLSDGKRFRVPCTILHWEI